MMAQCGALSDLIDAGARILECACGPCIGMGQSPNSHGISLRTFNRNFEGRSGTKDGQIYLVSPETAAISAITGVLTDPRTIGAMPPYVMPEHFVINDNMVVPPASPEEAPAVEILRGPNIKPFPINKPLAENIAAGVTLKVGDNITTDHIMPAGAKILLLGENIITAPETAVITSAASGTASSSLSALCFCCITATMNKNAGNTLSTPVAAIPISIAQNTLQK
jgi:aconitate hydratase